ncbi:MAG: Uncharacterised protein [Pseudidiomarina mangrovi]|nr:MAG: Uncharacterised protein [Pseudidiomarina mangrovi]
MSQSPHSPLEQQLAQRLQQAAALEAAQLTPLRWPLARRRSKWRWSVVPLATAAAIAWFGFSEQLLRQPPVTPDSGHIPPMLMAESYHIEALDQRIQQAYLAGDDEQTIATLWQQRHYWTEQNRLKQEWTQ